MVPVIILAKLYNSKVLEIPPGHILSRAFCDAVFITVLFVGKKNINKPIIVMNAYTVLWFQCFLCTTKQFSRQKNMYTLFQQGYVHVFGRRII